MKKFLPLALTIALILSSVGCTQTSLPETESAEPDSTDSVRIQLSDSGITVDGEVISSLPAAPVYAANDIVYYEDDHDFTYGEGSDADAHRADDAAAHTVVHITQPGTYILSGKLSLGQIAVDLGEDAEDNPDSVVTLVLDGIDVTCAVAPAVIFYNVYECGDKENPAKDVDTSAAGANVIISDGSTNYIHGSYVARIYKPDTVELNEAGTEVVDAKKLHKYDAAFYSKMSMNISGGQENSGILNIAAENEGLDSELHLTINGGNIHIKSGNDGINTNEDGISVTTINGGNLTIDVTGETGEGDGIDSNGWLVINGGTVIAAACSNSADSGIDSDMGIHINGGTVMATGHMLDRIEDGGQTYAVFNFAQTQSGDNLVTLKDESGKELTALAPVNDYSILLYSSPELLPGNYTLWSDSTLLSHGGTSFGGGGMMPRPSGTGGPTTPSEWEGQSVQDLPWTPVEGELPERPEPPEDMEMPGNRQHPRMNEDGSITLPDGTTIDPSKLERPEGDFGGRGMGGQMGGTPSGEISSVFTIADGGNMFNRIAAAE